MIRYALKCTGGHRFESWFQSAGAYDTLAKAGHLACAVCGTPQVDKELMAPRVAAKQTDAGAEDPRADNHSGQHPAQQPEPASARPLSRPAHPAEQALAALRKHVEKTSTYVGREFAAKAREMHLGETPHSTIHGEAAPDEARALMEDGIAVMPLPFRPTDTSN